MLGFFFSKYIEKCFGDLILFEKKHFLFSSLRILYLMHMTYTICVNLCMLSVRFLVNSRLFISS